jgi:hypothetical protein
MSSFGKIFIIAGAVFIVIGTLLFFAGKIPFIGKLPGDIVIQKKNFTFYFPLSTSIVISILLSLLLTLFFRFWGK